VHACVLAFVTVLDGHEIAHISFWFFASDVNIMGGIVHTIKEDTVALVVASKGIGLEVNADKSKYMVLSSDCRTKSRYED
jgi:hypothetical protein